ncbi:hypothetical protein SAMN05444166_6699 [Singulisphaera sp. GP187]|uniref:hypothetical protein n=1 Tax=Singulisphaera sp. GP187 TaxID=1882752 RepID=UPI00092BA9EB|nr:hypothetical protein [Singulisphaera sp. GP187]SIO61260.1 hypothetical protein SAMN05444166_6699 [Singulisphaera sp. GP187]
MSFLGRRIQIGDEDRSRVAERSGKRGLKPWGEVLEGRLLLSADGGAIKARGGFQILEFQGVPFGHDVGTGFSGETLADFSKWPQSTAGDFNVTIDWGDNSAPTSGTVGRYSFTNDFDVEGDHAYAQTGNYTITVTIKDSDGHTAIVNDQATIKAGPLASTPTDVNTVVGSEFGSHTLGQFYDARGLQEPDGYQVTIDWGDGTTSAGSLERLLYPGGNAPYLKSYGIEGSHTYQNNGHFAITVSITDNDGHSTTLTSQATVALENVKYPTPVLFPTTGTALTNVQVATLDFPGPFRTAGVVEATIDWGDGTPPTQGQLAFLVPTSLNGGPPVMFVSGNHTYAQAGSYAIRVTVTKDDGATLVAVGPAYALVSDPIMVSPLLPPSDPPAESPPVVVGHPVTLGPAQTVPPPAPPAPLVATPPQIAPLPSPYPPTEPVVKAIRHHKPVRQDLRHDSPAHRSPAPNHDHVPVTVVTAIRHRNAVLQQHGAVVRHASLAVGHGHARRIRPSS